MRVNLGKLKADSVAMAMGRADAFDTAGIERGKCCGCDCRLLLCRSCEMSTWFGGRVVASVLSSLFCSHSCLWNSLEIREISFCLVSFEYLLV